MDLVELDLLMTFLMTSWKQQGTINIFFNIIFLILFFCRNLILKKEEEKQKFDFEECQKELQLTLKTQQGQIDRIESQIQLLLQLCSKK